MNREKWCAEKSSANFWMIHFNIMMTNICVVKDKYQIQHNKVGELQSVKELVTPIQDKGTDYKKHGMSESSLRLESLVALRA